MKVGKDGEVTCSKPASNGGNAKTCCYHGGTSPGKMAESQWLCMPGPTANAGAIRQSTA